MYILQFFYTVLRGAFY